jgi:excisionase family DNA binding protein
MTTTTARRRRATPRSIQDLAARQARDLARLPADASTAWALRTGSTLTDVPPELAQTLTAVLSALAEGRAVLIEDQPEELTTTAAAEALGMSRPTLMKLVASGDLAAHKVGTHTRFRASDVTAYRSALLERRRQAFAELIALEDEALDAERVEARDRDGTAPGSA